MRTPPAVALLAGLWAALQPTPPAEAQAPAPATPLATERPADSGATPRWLYPRGERRDPVVPPPALYSGEGFPQLRLSVILFDPADPRGSRALVQLNGPEPVRRVVRAGDRVGGFEIHRIERGRVLVRVETLGSARLEVLLPMRGDSAVVQPR